MTQRPKASASHSPELIAGGRTEGYGEFLRTLERWRRRIEPVAKQLLELRDRRQE
jgi:hypothetical protein